VGHKQAADRREFSLGRLAAGAFSMRITSALIVVGCVLSLAACEKRAETGNGAGAGTASGTASGLGDAMNSAKDMASDTFTKLRDQAVATLEPRLEAAKTQVASLKDKVATLPEAIKPTVSSGVAEVEKQLDAAGTQFSNLKSAGADTWQSISTELGSTLDKLGTAIKDLTAKFPS